jgi:chromosome partitioning protein
VVVRIIALMNQKGGVGKTTTTANLGAALALAGKKVCVVDLDPQAHLTINYGLEQSPDATSVYHVLIDEAPLADATRKVNQNLWIVPSSIDLAGAEIELTPMIAREQRLGRAIASAHLDYDYMLLDCPPSLGLLTINALAVAGEVIIPMQAHFLAMQGVAKLLETVQLVSRRLNSSLRVSGIVLTMHDAQTKLGNEVVAELRQFIDEAAGKPLPWAGARIFESKIRRNIKLAECPSFGKTILDYDPHSHGAADYRALSAEVIDMAKQPSIPRPQVTVTTTVTTTGAAKRSTARAQTQHDPAAAPSPEVAA